MAITARKAKLPSTTLSPSSVEQDYIHIKLDNNYPTGGYPIDIKTYSSVNGFVEFITNYGDSIGGSYDASTKKLLITRAGSEIANGTDLSGVEGFIRITKVPGINNPTLAPTTAVQDETGGNYLKKNADDSISSGVTITVAQGAALAIEGSVIMPDSTPITSDGQDVWDVNQLSMTVASPDTLTELTSSSPVNGQEITITAEVAKIIWSAPGSNIVLFGGSPMNMKVGDTLTLRFYAADMKWYEISRHTADGTVDLLSTGTFTAVPGSVVEINGVIIQTDSITEIDTDGQTTYGINSLKITTNTPPEITDLNPSVAYNGQRIRITWEAARTMNSSGNILLNGAIPLTGQAGDYIVLEWCSLDSKWHEVERHISV